MDVPTKTRHWPSGRGVRGTGFTINQTSFQLPSTDVYTVLS